MCAKKDLEKIERLSIDDHARAIVDELRKEKIPMQDCAAALLLQEKIQKSTDNVHYAYSTIDEVLTCAVGGVYREHYLEVILKVEELLGINK